MDQYLCPGDNLTFSLFVVLFVVCCFFFFFVTVLLKFLSDKGEVPSQSAVVRL